MIISEHETRTALALVKSGASRGVADVQHSVPNGLPKDFVEKVRRLLEDMPEVRVERIESARRHLDARTVTSEEIASKMLGRIVSDSLR